VDWSCENTDGERETVDSVVIRLQLSVEPVIIVSEDGVSAVLPDAVYS
jgi:hypothetical protein